MFVKTSELTKGEKLRLQRRRTGETQQRAASRLGVSLHAYRQWERDEADAAPTTALGRLPDYEQCFILRRREEETLGKVAGDLGVCKGWLMQMERGIAPIARLTSYWEQRTASA